MVVDALKGVMSQWKVSACKRGAGAGGGTREGTLFISKHAWIRVHSYMDIKSRQTGGLISTEQHNTHFAH